MRTWLIIFVALLVLVLGSSYAALEHVPEVSAQGQQGTTVVGECDCDGFNVTATKLPTAGLPPGSCGYKLTISQTYPTTGNVHVPKGIRITVQSPVTFQSVVSLTGMTLSVNTPTMVQWNSTTPLQNTGSLALANILLNPNGVSPQQVLVEWLDETGVTMCRAIIKLECPCRKASAAADDQDLCFGQTTTVKLSPPPQAGSVVTWYNAPMLNGTCPTPIPDSGTPTTGWSPAQFGGNTCNTNVLPNSTCYQAVITEGPSCTYASTVATVNVAHVANLGNLNPQTICKSGTNTFSITDPYLVAHPNLVTWLLNGSPVASGVTTFTTPTLTATAASDCPVHIYNYSVSVADSGCGAQTRNLPITVYHESDAGILTANPAGPLCYDQATKIHAAPVCGQVTKWEQSTVGPLGPWSAIPGAGNTTDFWTPELLQTTWYQVTVANGICPAKTSVIKIEVKPKLAVTLTSNGTALCNSPIILTAQPPTGYPPPLTYTWYRNGVQIAGPTSVPTLPVNQPGNYRVVITDPACGKAKSNVIRIYPRPRVVISGPCGICQGGSVTLKANVIGGDPSCAYTFNWTANTGGWTGTGQTVNVTPNLSPNGSITYSVTTSCAGCTVTAQHTVRRCPP